MWKAIFAVVVVVAGLSACAQVPTDPDDLADYKAINDPLEPMNRAIFTFNDKVDQAVLQPVARTYRTVIPIEFQHGIHNVLNNLSAPYTLANDLLQGNWRRARDTIERFFFNSTAGIFGLFDVAAVSGGPRYHSEDFGQTLAVWGVGSGPYLVLPLLGPSNPRDAVGRGVGFVADPTDIYLSAHNMDREVWERFGTGVVDDRVQLLDPIDDLKRASLDFYAAVRSVYRQRRANDIANKDISAAESYLRGAGK